ncbi:organic cation transporter protein [Hyalella azteca]|uniref:Organic cation transporter protein n=1 Tax=Hyalella azteca TaxID=294128 RepID=A0A8B7PKF8_HYAAZ|nr:organic cation transporter protein [Hyalella azteca]
MKRSSNSPAAVPPTGELDTLGPAAAPPAGELDTLEDVFELVGTKGAYNILVLIACSAVGLMTPMQILSSDFLGKAAPHWCDVPELQAANWTMEQIRNFSSPDPAQNYMCSRRSYDYGIAAQLGFEAVMEDTNVVPGGDMNETCSSLVFQDGIDSIVTEWSLVCDRLVWSSHAVAASHAGLCLGSLLFGYILDRVGRRIGLMVAITMFVPCGLAVAAAVNIHMYIVFRILVTMFGMGMYLGGFVLSMELCTPRQRSLVSSYFVVPWAVGYMATSAIAYTVTSWRYLQVALTVPAIALYCNLCLVPESPRWLIRKGRYEEALSILTKMALRNKRKMPSDDDMSAALRRICPRKVNNVQWSAVSWLRTWIYPQLQWKTPVVFFCWFSVSMVYYGLSQGSANLGVNEYQFIFVGGALEVAAYLVIYPGVTMLGRRVFLALTYAVAAVSIGGVMGMMMTGFDGGNGGLLFLSYSGKFMITAAFHVLYVITGELFPTELRSLIIGEASVCARIGSIMSPYINILVGSEVRWAPAAFFGSFSIASAILAAFLPETRGLALDEELKATKNQEARTPGTGSQGDEELKTKKQEEGTLGAGYQGGKNNPYFSATDDTLASQF